MMKLPKRHATPGRGPACTNHNCHLARLGVTVVFVKPPSRTFFPAKGRGLADFESAKRGITSS